MRKMMIFGSMILSLLGLAPYGFADEGGKPAIKSTQMKVHGVVSKVQSGLTTVKTSWGTMTIASTFTPNVLEVGEEVEMLVNENNAVIDVLGKGEKRHFHRFVSGDLTYTSADHNDITLWTPGGEKVFDVQSGRSKMSKFEEGAPVTVELNEAGKVIDIHRFTVEMSFDEHPRTTPGYVIQVNGTVTKIQSGLISVKTPTGLYTISAKTAPANAAVGDEVSLWLNEGNMVIDHHGKEKNMKGTHRLIFGKLIYTGRTKNQIKLSTPEGEKVFPLERLDVKTKPIAEGSQIVVELNEEGTVIDLWKAQ
jgi:hemin uptake protein HemP